MQKLKSLLVVPAATLAILSAPVAITATQVATVAVPMAVVTATMLPATATAGLVLSERPVSPWQKLKDWVSGLVLSE